MSTLTLSSKLNFFISFFFVCLYSASADSLLFFVPILLIYCSIFAFMFHLASWFSKVSVSISSDSVMLKLLLGDPNARKLKRYQPIVTDINLLEEDIAPLSDDLLREKTASISSVSPVLAA